MTISQDTFAASGNLQLLSFPYGTQLKSVSLRFHYCETWSQPSQCELLNTWSAEHEELVQDLRFCICEI